MADVINNDKWPLTKFYFLVEFKDGVESDAVGEISFQEVSGLDQEVDLVEYRHGDSSVFSNMKKPGMIKYTNVVFKKGYFRADARLTTLFNSYTKNNSYYNDDPKSRLQITIKLLDNDSKDAKPLVQWDLLNAFPTKLTGTDLKSDATEIAIETLEVAHEGLTAQVISG